MSIAFSDLPKSQQLLLASWVALCSNSKPTSREQLPLGYERAAGEIAKLIGLRNGRKFYHDVQTVPHNRVRGRIWE